jgi:hypothetical protein
LFAGVVVHRRTCSAAGGKRSGRRSGKHQTSLHHHSLCCRCGAEKNNTKPAHNFNRQGSSA